IKETESVENKPGTEKISAFESKLKIFEQTGKANILTTICIVVVVLGILAPNLSLIGGQYIRQFTMDESSREIQIIRDYDKGITIQGNVISVKEGSYYISNKEWRLEIIKGDKIYVAKN
ncbi:MAG: hypothetical protein J7639_30655, partial [Paenibacillaceae bacterium]|nr:hypothetical protein [Paenibacillaceae bacterium]